MSKSGFRLAALLAPAICLFAQSFALGGVTIGAESKIAPDPREDYARFVRFRPADGQTVTLNPPRISWPYFPGIVPKEDETKADMRFTLQIASSRDFAKPDVEVKDTICNFYNFLPELKGAQTWHWRVGYSAGGAPVKWSDTRSFTLAPSAVVWDRAGVGEALTALKGHPRMLFNAANRDAALAQRKSNAYSEKLAQHIIAAADGVLKQKWFTDFPKDDSKKLSQKYMDLADGLLTVAFARLLTGDGKYTGFKERFLTMASWPKGGLSSPEGIRRETDKWETHLTNYIGLFYDWFYDELTPAERAVVRGSLEWRINHTMNEFAWRKNDGKGMRSGSIAVNCGSHPFENTMVTIPGALAICDESAIGREALEIGVHYIIGITSGHGEDEAWHDGAGYGNGKMKWLTDATCYLQTAIPQLDLGKNEAYSAYRDFFARLTPVGAQHCSFGNRGYSEQDWMGSRVHNMRRVAMLRQDVVAMQNWLETQKRFKELGRDPVFPGSPWIDYVLPLYFREPAPKPETEFTRLFPLEGWVTVSSAAPSDFAAQKNAVSMTFACRPRGGYGHSFRNENAFDIHAYGNTIAVGGGTTHNQSIFSNHTMSHNTVLVNGREQEAAASINARRCGRIAAWRQGDGFVYWAGDATPAYGAKTGLGRFIRHALFIDNAYFVLFDDLALRDGEKPGTFQWLYHVTPPVELSFDEKSCALQYEIKGSRALVQHAAHVGDLTMQNLRGIKGQINPITGEDVTQNDKGLKDKDGNVIKEKNVPPPLDGHHLWYSHKTPRTEMQFLAVIAPYRSGEEAPVVTPVSDTSVRVAFRGKEKLIAFAADPQADIAVDARAIRE